MTTRQCGDYRKPRARLVETPSITWEEVHLKAVCWMGLAVQEVFMYPQSNIPTRLILLSSIVKEFTATSNLLQSPQGICWRQDNTRPAASIGNGGPKHTISENEHTRRLFYTGLNRTRRRSSTPHRTRRGTNRHWGKRKQGTPVVTTNPAKSASFVGESLRST